MISLVSTIRDVIELISPFEVDSILEKTQFPIFQALAVTGLYFVKSIPAGLFYLISGQWLRDYTLLPITAPEYASAVVKEYPIFDLDLPGMGLSVLKIPSIKQNTFVIGLINSFFFALPNSVIYFIAFRRFFFFDLPAAVYTLLGYLLGQWLFVAAVVFGLRSIIIPWVTCEPLRFILGFALLWITFAEYHRDNYFTYFAETPRSDVHFFWNFDLDWKFYPQYRKYFLVSLILSWCELGSIFQYFANMSGTTLASFLETPPNSGFIEHSFYLIGLLIGLLLFSTVVYPVAFKVRDKIMFANPRPFVGDPSPWFAAVRNLNNSFMYFGILTSVTLPFYAMDYLVTAPLGFLSGDLAFAHGPSGFNKYNAQDRYDNSTSARKLDFPGMGKSFRKTHREGTFLGELSSGQGLNVDTSDTDKGRYLIFPQSTFIFEDRTRFTFEDLNIRGEKWWMLHRSFPRYNIANPKIRKLSFANLARDAFPEHRAKRAYFQDLIDHRFPPRLISRPENVKVQDTFKLQENDPLAPVRQSDDVLKLKDSNTGSPVNAIIYRQPTWQQELQDKLSEQELFGETFFHILTQQNLDNSGTGGQNSRSKGKQSQRVKSNRFLDRQSTDTATPSPFFEENELIRAKTSQIQDENNKKLDINTRFFGVRSGFGYNSAYRLSAYTAFPDEFRTGTVPPVVQIKARSPWTHDQAVIGELLGKQQVYRNNLFKLLLRGDIDFFLHRQPRRYRLRGSQEFDLYQKREMLEAYSDTLRAYTEMPKYHLFESLFTGPKSFANKVYNQQFKGTLKVTGRRFALTINPNSKYIQKSDMSKPMLQFEEPQINGDINPSEESVRAEAETAMRQVVQVLREKKNSESTNTSPLFNPAYKRNIPTILKFDQPLYRDKKSTPLSFWHEELEPLQEEQIIKAEMEAYSIPAWKNTQKKARKDIDNVPPSTMEMEPLSTLLPLGGPVYAGWDETNRQFILSSKLLPRELAGYVFNVPRKRKMAFARDKLPPQPSNMVFGRGEEYGQFNKGQTNARHIRFTSWPITDELLMAPKSVSLYPFETMTESPLDPLYRPWALQNHFLLRTNALGEVEENFDWNMEQEPILFDKIYNKLWGFNDSAAVKKLSNANETARKITNFPRKTSYLSSLKEKNSIQETVNKDFNNVFILKTENPVGARAALFKRVPKELVNLRTLPSTIRRYKQQLLEISRQNSLLLTQRFDIREEINKSPSSDRDTVFTEAESQMNYTTRLEVRPEDNLFKQIKNWLVKQSKSKQSRKARKRIREAALLRQFSQYHDPRLAYFLFDQQMRYVAPRRGGFIWPGNARPRFLIPDRVLPIQAVPYEKSNIAEFENKTLMERSAGERSEQVSQSQNVT